VVQATHSRRVGVLATQGTVDSGSYVRAIHNLDAGVQVWQAPSPRSVTVVERTLAAPTAMYKDWMSDKQVFDTAEIEEIAETDIEPLRGHGIDAVILGCTHFPLLKPAFQKAFGPGVQIVSSAEETAREVRSYLTRNGTLADGGHVPQYRFATTSTDLVSFAVAGSFVFGRKLESIEHVDIDHLETLAPARVD
jgi:glutamate racemase